MAVKEYDVVIIGGGAAGLVASVSAGALGARTGLVERDRLGGECSWTGCIPSKALVAAASLAYRSGQHPEGVMEQIRQTTLRASQASKAKELLHKYKVDIHYGHPRFQDNTTLELPDVAIRARKFIICTGSSPKRPMFPGLTEGYLTNQEVWDLPDRPVSLVIIGGGPLGVELAQAFHRLGTKICLVHAHDRVLPHDDAELSEELTKILIREGMEIHLGTPARTVERKPEGWYVQAGEKVLFGEHLLLALGRQANAGGLNLAAAGIHYDQDRIHVNKYLRTAARNIWAAGDCIGGLRFSHIAELEVKTAVRNALFPFNTRPNYQGTPWATFTDPELAHLGLTEQECQARNLTYRVYTQSFSGDDRAIVDGTTKGKVKILASPFGKLLGVHILGPRAGELINELVLARRKGLRLHDVGLTAHVYPSLGLALQRATDEWFAELAERPWVQFLLKVLRR